MSLYIARALGNSYNTTSTKYNINEFHYNIHPEDIKNLTYRKFGTAIKTS